MAMIDLTMEELGAEEESAGQTGAARATDHIMEVPDEEVHFAEVFHSPEGVATYPGSWHAWGGGHGFETGA